jgi:RimJ/RimL family protein N-acetyltransferase
VSCVGMIVVAGHGATVRAGRRGAVCGTSPRDGERFELGSQTLGMVESMLPIRTARTLVRSMTLEDAPVVIAYRNDPAVAKYQDWDLPVPAERVIAQLGTDRPDDVAAGVHTNLAIEVDGAVVGDVYVGIDEDGGVAEIGFTLAAEHQGKGYAGEAAGAVAEALFERLDLVRLSGQLDPENIASQRTLERIGLVFESRSPMSYRVRGEWVDNMVYAATREQFDEWRNRSRGQPTDVRLVELTEANESRYRRVETHYSQRRFVAPVLDSMADALFPEVYDGEPVVPWYRGIEADGEPVGFLMIADATAAHPEPYVWRLLIDRLHQGRGIGRRAVELLIERFRQQGVASCTISWEEGPGSPRPFYERFGFVPTGEIVDGETEARLLL